MIAADRATRTDRLAADLADAILAGELAPGRRLDEAGVAKRFSVSRTPVREALRQLAASGLIEVRPRRGAIVAHFNEAQLEELFVAMGELEATCARLSALSMSPLERRRLQALHAEMKALATRGDKARYADANMLFHSAIYAGAHNTMLSDTAHMLRRRVAPFRRAQFRAPGRLKRSHAEHDAVVRTVVRGDAAGAHEAMLHHVSLVEIAFEHLSKEASKPDRNGASASRRVPVVMNRGERDPRRPSEA